MGKLAREISRNEAQLFRCPLLCLFVYFFFFRRRVLESQKMLLSGLPFMLCTYMCIVVSLRESCVTVGPSVRSLVWLKKGNKLAAVK